MPQNTLNNSYHSLSLFTGEILDITAFNLRPLLNYEAEKTFFGGYKSSTDIDATISLGRAVDTGTGQDWPPFPFDSTLEPAALGGRSSRLMLPATIGLSRVGAFYVDAEKGGIYHRMITITMARNGEFLFLLESRNCFKIGNHGWKKWRNYNSSSF